MSGLKNQWTKDGKYYPNWDSNDWENGTYTTGVSNEPAEADGGYSYFNDHCNPSEPRFDGPAGLKPNNAVTNDNFVGTKKMSIDEYSFAYLKGNTPRKPTRPEFNSIVYVFDLKPLKSQFPNFVGKCWWVSEDTGTYEYDCIGYCTALVKVEDNSKKSLPLEQDVANFFRDESFPDGFLLLETFGLIRVEGDSSDIMKDSKAKIAIFSEPHVAIKSCYLKNNEERLWESKIGAAGDKKQCLRILHSLKDIEGGAYGNVVAYYKYP